MTTTDSQVQSAESIFEKATAEEKEILEVLKEKIDSDDDVPEGDKESFFVQMATHLVGDPSDEASVDHSSDEAWKMLIELVKTKMGMRGVWVLQDDTLQPRLKYVIGDGTGKRIEITIIYDIEHDCIQVRGGYHFKISPNSMSFAKSYACELTYQWRFTSMCLDSSDGEIYVSLTYPWKNHSALPEDLTRYIEMVTITALGEYENAHRYANDIISNEEVDIFVKDVQKSMAIEAISKSLDEEA